MELKTYDKLLDKRIEKAYGSLRSVFEQLQELYSMVMKRVDVYRAMSLEFLVMLLIVSLVILEVFMVIKL